MDEINKIPPVTRTLLFATMGVTVPCLVQVLNPYLFILWWPAVLREWHVWRPFTCFFFAGTSGLQVLFDIFMLHRNSTDLELNSFYRKTADYTWALILINTMILLINYPLSTAVFFSPFTMAIVYLWSRANRHASVNLFGLINCPAKYLPYVYLLFDLLRGGMPYAITSATGILSAHIYHFLKDVLPATNGGRGPRYLPNTPVWLQRLLPDSPDPTVQGQTPQPGGSVRSTAWGGTAFAPAGRSFGDGPAGGTSPLAGGQRLNSQTSGGARSGGGGFTSWLPFGRSATSSTTVGGGSGSVTAGLRSGSATTNRPDRDAMLAAAEARLRSLRESSIAGRNQAASTAARQAANSAEAQARSSRATTSGSTASAPAERILRNGESGAKSTGVRTGYTDGSATTSRRTTGKTQNISSLRSSAGNEDGEDEEQETASGSGGRVAEIRRATGSKDKDDERLQNNDAQEDQQYTWGTGRRLGNDK